MRSVHDQAIGAAIRAIRQRRRWRQADLAARADVSPTLVARVERGALANVPFGKIVRIALVLDARLECVVRWQGGDLYRLINARHAAMHESTARLFRKIGTWTVEPEVSFSIYGERGVIDILAWHPASRSLLVIELKTELVDVNEMLGTLDRKGRLGATIARERGWDPASISVWVVLAESRTNRRAVSAHSSVIRSKLPVDGRTVRSWLRQPSGRIRALSFLSSRHRVAVRRDLAPTRRVTRCTPRAGNRD